MRPSRTRRGTTLLELSVTIALIALATTIASLAARRMDIPYAGGGFAMRLARARQAALTSARPERITLVRHDTVFMVTALPDGGLLADSSLHLNRLSARHLAPPGGLTR